MIQAAREEGLAVEGVVVALPSGDRAGVEIRTSAHAAPAAPRPDRPGRACALAGRTRRVGLSRWTSP